MGYAYGAHSRCPEAHQYHIGKRGLQRRGRGQTRRSALRDPHLLGIVCSTGIGESDNLVHNIQNLIDEYLRNPRCVILAVHPAPVDFHNSQSMADAKSVDPQTKRTLPVLTKPDLIDAGAEMLLVDGKTTGLDKGFHMLKGCG